MARRTLAGHFIEETFGASVQHLALATDDIFAAAAGMQARGFPFLQIGANCYADLEARFGLDPEFAARLKARNIMYDEDRTGRFLQFYSTVQPSGDCAAGWRL